MIFLRVLVLPLMVLLNLMAARGGLLPPIVMDVVSGFETKSYDKAFREQWGKPRKVDNQGQHIELSLDTNSKGGGFISQERWYHGFFSAAIKLPGNYSAGVITAFYTSNQDLYPHTHDEFDLEFLGVRPGGLYTLQTNIYGHGSTYIGREERLHLWFDPTEDYHHYSILWNQYHTVFYVDNIPVREMVKIPELGLQYPSKPQTLITTIWDGSAWATEGGRYGVDYSSAHKAYFKDMKVEGCVWNDTVEELPPCASSDSAAFNRLDGPDYQYLNEDQKAGMRWVRKNWLWYSYCDDTPRYPTPPVDCPPREEGVVEAGASKQGTSSSSNSSHHHHRRKGNHHDRNLSEGRAFSRKPSKLL